MEPNTKLDVHGTPGQVGHGYQWDGELVGAGSMKIASNESGKQQMDLEFLRPFKSKAQVLMVIKPIGESQTEVAWHMDGKMPFFLFFMLDTMKTMIGMDYERGLKMLKEYVETGGIQSKVEIEGVVDLPESYYLGVEARCTLAEMGDSMKETLPAAYKSACDKQVEMKGAPGALYHDFDFKKKACHYTAIVQTESPAEIDGLKSGAIGGCKAIKVKHTGSYDHLGNAWTAAMSYQRYKKLKPLKTQCGFELYANDPGETPVEELLTEVFVPIRG